MSVVGIGKVGQLIGAFIIADFVKGFHSVLQSSSNSVEFKSSFTAKTYLSSFDFGEGGSELVR